MPGTIDPLRIEQFVLDHPIALIEVWAAWSGNAFLVAAVLDRLLRESTLRGVARARIDVATHPEVLERFGLEGVPAVLIYSRGRLVERRVGLVNSEALGSRLRELLSTPYSEDSP